MASRIQVLLINSVRGKAKAFAWDALSVRWVQQGWKTDLFETLTPIQQAFSLLPLIHSENLPLHDLAIKHYEQLTTLLKDQDSILTAFLSSAKEHRAIIKLFGRYPHRNAVLNRVSTTAEDEYLNSGGARFGQ
jgi:uncharacterized protein (DUF924 family)